MQASDHIRSVLEYRFQSPDPWNDDILGWSKHKVSQRHRPKSPWRHRTLRTHWYGDSRLPHALTNLFLPSRFVISCTARQRWRSSQNRRRGTPVCFGWAGDTTTPPPFSFCPIVHPRKEGSVRSNKMYGIYLGHVLLESSINLLVTGDSMAESIVIDYTAN
jgi:hypothetical protein